MFGKPQLTLDAVRAVWFNICQIGNCERHAFHCTLLFSCFHQIDPYHIGPAIPEVNSLWFKLFLYDVTGSGPPSLLLCKGTRLRTLPKIFAPYSQLLITSWGHDPGVLPTSNALFTVNDALTHSAVLLQVWMTSHLVSCGKFEMAVDG